MALPACLCAAPLTARVDAKLYGHSAGADRVEHERSGAVDVAGADGQDDVLRPRAARDRRRRVLEAWRPRGRRSPRVQPPRPAAANPDGPRLRPRRAAPGGLGRGGRGRCFPRFAPPRPRGAGAAGPDPPPPPSLPPPAEPALEELRDLAAR